MRANEIVTTAEALRYLRHMFPRTIVSALNPARLRTAASLVAAAAIAALWLLGASNVQAISQSEVKITPADAHLTPGNTITVSVDVTAPDDGDDGLSVWVIKIGYDPAVVQVDSISGNPACQALAVPNPPGSGSLVQSYGCDTNDASPADGTDETAVTFGGWVKNVSGTATGWTGMRTLATFTFEVVGSLGQSSPLTVNVCDEFPDPADCDRFLGPAEQKHYPPDLSEIDGQITIANDTTRKWGDADCGGSLTVSDARKIALAALGLPYTQPAGCPSPTETRTVDGVPRKWGDVDCNGALDVRDARKVALAALDLPYVQPPNCPVLDSWALVE